MPAKRNPHLWQHEPSTPSEYGSLPPVGGWKLDAWNWQAQSDTWHWQDSSESSLQLAQDSDATLQVLEPMPPSIPSALSPSESHHEASQDSLNVDFSWGKHYLLSDLVAMDATTQTSAPTVKPLPPRPRNATFGPAAFKNPPPAKSPLPTYVLVGGTLSSTASSSGVSAANAAAAASAACEQAYQQTIPEPGMLPAPSFALPSAVAFFNAPNQLIPLVNNLVDIYESLPHKSPPVSNHDLQLVPNQLTLLVSTDPVVASSTPEAQVNDSVGSQPLLHSDDQLRDVHKCSSAGKGDPHITSASELGVAGVFFGLLFFSFWLSSS